MSDEFEDTAGDMARLDQGVTIRRPPKSKNVRLTQRLRAAEDKLRREDYTPMKFLRVASFTFSTSNKSYFSQLLQNLDDDPDLGGEIPSDEEDEEDGGDPHLVGELFYLLPTSWQLNLYIFRTTTIMKKMITLNHLLTHLSKSKNRETVQSVSMGHSMQCGPVATYFVYNVQEQSKQINNRH